MRRKDLRYYFKTVGLRLKGKAFELQKGNRQSLSKLAQRRAEYKEKFDSTELTFTDFQPYFHTYSYFTDSSIFGEEYLFHRGFPIALSGGMKSPLLPLYFALVLHNQQYSEGTTDSKVFREISEYTITNSDHQLGLLKLQYEEDFKLFGLSAPWISGITQSISTSFFCRMYFIEKDVKYLQLAEEAIAPCLISVESGGLLCSTHLGLEWVEEYPSDPASYVLNGHMFSIIAVIELYQLTGKSLYYSKATEWIKSLVAHIAEYQYKEYLLHNTYQIKLSNIEYQGLYVGLFKHLYELTRHPLFLEFYDFYNANIDWTSFKKFYGIKN